mgnify:CR=1 FL=1
MTCAADTHGFKLLKEALGDSVCCDASVRYQASMDNLRLSVLPQAVIYPRSEAEVGVVLKLANESDVPVTTRGAGSAATGATTPFEGGWVLDLSRWTQCSIDPVSGMAMVQPGVITGDLQRAAESQGWFYPPDPSSAQYSTIGGNVATNAGGLRAAKYGVTRDYVLGLEGFLPTGEFVQWGGPLKKFASGLNMRDLWIGSEGMLGVITKIVLRLVPKPQERTTFLAAFPDEISGLNAVRSLLEQRLVPAALEFMDRQTVACTERYSGFSPFSEAPGHVLLLVELDGHPSVLKEEREVVFCWAKERAVVFSEATGAEAESLWRVRRACSQAMFTMGDTKLNEDVVVPLNNQQALLAHTLELHETYGLATPTFGHAADGNFHVHIMFNRADGAQAKQAEGLLEALMKKVVELGGAITGEHGIGLAKSTFLRIQHSDSEVSAMQSIKDSLDPRGILNPGKMFTPVRTWAYPVEAVKMPWDHC